jgi:hypothetical protein
MLSVANYLTAEQGWEILRYAQDDIRSSSRL